MDLRSAAQLVSRLAVEQGAIMMDRWGTVLEARTKDPEGLDLVTEVDVSTERSLVEQLTAAFPETGFQLEEEPELERAAEYEWVIDPIDGTKYFASAVPLFCTSIGLTQAGKPVLGVIYHPVSRQLYVGGVGIPATLNGHPVRVRQEDRLSHTMVSVDFSKSQDDWRQMQSWIDEKLRLLAGATYRIRMFGTGALSLAWVAGGSIVNAYVSLSGVKKLMDVAAGIAICEAAGGTVLVLEHPMNGKPLVIAGQFVVVSKLRNLLG